MPTGNSLFQLLLARFLITNSQTESLEVKIQLR